ncbi:MAG: hypothetical protein ACREFQ_16450, partial [Stellaceae bacterium]
NWATALNLISIATGAAAALLLYWGSLGVPWKLRSWTGETTIEKRYERTQRMMAWVGIPCVFVAAACQAAVVIAGSN